MPRSIDSLHRPTQPATNGIPLEHFESLAAQEISYWWHLSRVNWASSLLKRYDSAPQDRRVLDIGCGTGGFLHLMNQRFEFADILGVDAVDSAIGMARRLGNCYEVIPPTGYIPDVDRDLIFLMDVIEHIEDDTGFLVNTMKPLASGSRVLLSVPAMPWLYSEWDQMLGHFRRYTKETLRHAVTTAGARPLEITYGFSYLVPATYLRKAPDENVAEVDATFVDVPGWLNRFLISLSRLEIACAKKLTIPVGNSIFALIEKP